MDSPTWWNVIVIIALIGNVVMSEGWHARLGWIVSCMFFVGSLATR